MKLASEILKNVTDLKKIQRKGDWEKHVLSRVIYVEENKGYDMCDSKADVPDWFSIRNQVPILELHEFIYLGS